MRKKLIGSILLSLVLVMAAGCSGSNSGTNASQSNEPQSSAESKEKRTVTFATIAGYYTDGLKEAAQEYTKLNPETEVVIDVIKDNDTYQANFKAKMAAGGKDAPDIVHINLIGETSSADAIDKGWLLKLNDYVNQPNPYNGDKTVFEGIDPEYHQNTYSRDGDVAYLPFDLVGTGFYYNKDIFAKLGISEPQTWEELLAACKQLQDAGYIPITMPFGFESTITQAFLDWSAKSLYPELLIQPGDARYDEKIHKLNTSIAYSPDNGNFDFGASYDPEKQLLALKNKQYDMQGAAQRKIWTVMKELSAYYQPGYATMQDPDVYQLFIAQKAAIYWNGSWQVGTLLDDMKKLGDKAFAWGTFKFPEFAEADPLFPGKPRGILVPGHLLGIADKKDPEQESRTKDFMMYLYSPEVAQKVFETTLAAGQFVQGPSLVLGVKLPDEVNDYLTGFKVDGSMGYAIANAVPSSDTNQAKQSAQLKYYEGKLSLDEFLAEQDNILNRDMDIYIKAQQYDLDPKTNP